MPRLAELDPRFVQHRMGIASEYHGRKMPDGSTQWGGFEIEEMHDVDSLVEAHGIMFGCPKCFVKNGNSMVGTHQVLVSFKDRNFPANFGSHDSKGKPSRWQVSGTDFGNLTTTPSILLHGAGCGWHGFITNGEVTII